MPISSRNVAPSASATATDYNNLRADVLSNHDHDGTEGARVNHSDLTHPNSYSPSNTHQAIDTHMGASQNVHTLAATEYVMGAWSGHHTVVAFKSTICYPGGGGLTASIPITGGRVVTIPLPTTLANTNYFVAMSFGNAGGGGVHGMVVADVLSKTTSSFTVNLIAVAQGNDITSCYADVIVVGTPVRS